MSAARKPKIQARRPARVEPAGDITRRPDVFVPAIIFIVALGVRLLHLFQIESIPLFYHLASDGRSYDEWAQRIAGGDWWGGEVFYQAPLYPYFLGLLQFIMGRDLWSIRVVQVILGAASCVFLYWAGKSFFSRGAGIAAGFMLALYAPAIFFDALIQKTVLDIVLISLLLLLVGSTMRNPASGRWVVIGAVLGLLGLSRENALVWAFVIAIWVWFYFSAHPSRTRLRWAMFFAAGVMLVLLPVGLRNLSIGGELTLTTSQLGPNFFIGNNPDADGSYAPLLPGRGDPKFERQDATQLAEQAVGRKLSPGEVSRYWLGRAGDYIIGRPLEWLGLTVKKWLMVWNFRELEDADDYYLYQRFSPLLDALATFSHFGLLVPFAAMGCFLTWREWRKIWVLHALILSMAASVALFYVFGRYRLPLIPPLMLLAGAGAMEIIALCRSRSIGRCAAALGMLIVVGAIVNWPVTGKSGPSSAGYNNLGNAFGKQQAFAAAKESYEQALALQPDYGVAYFNLGNLLAKMGDVKAAAHHLSEAIKINPTHAEAYHSLGNLLAQQGDFDGALQQYRKALDLGLVRADTYLNMALVEIKLGRLREGTESLKESLRVNPDNAAALDSLGRVLAAQGEMDQAMDYFQRALKVDPNFAEAHESLARAFAERGERDQAARHYQEAVRILKSRRAPGR